MVTGKGGWFFLAGNFLETNPVAYGDGIAIFNIPHAKSICLLASIILEDPFRIPYWVIAVLHLS